MTTAMQFRVPVSLQERIVSLDMLRGLAVMGILIMNIQSYSMIGAAYINPTAYGDLTGLNKWIWILNHLSDFHADRFWYWFANHNFRCHKKFCC